MSDHFDSYTLHIAHAMMKKGDLRMFCLTTAPFYTVLVVVTKLQRLGVRHNIAGHVIAHRVDSSHSTSSDPRPRFMTQETRIGGNEFDVSLGPWPPGFVRSLIYALFSPFYFANFLGEA